MLLMVGENAVGDGAGVGGGGGGGGDAGLNASASILGTVVPRLVIAPVVGLIVMRCEV